jgi:hypothetical protein
MKRMLKEWWHGTYVSPESRSSSGLIFVLGSRRRHWTSKVAHVVADFWMDHWQWCFSAIFAMVGLVIAAMKL